MDLRPGALLVAEPAMLDPNFKRAVILLCEHNDEGSFGLIINKPTSLQLEQVLAEPAGIDHRLFLGGPVQPDTLHFLHAFPSQVAEAQTLADGLAWGGPFPDIAERIRLGVLDPSGFRFFAGYAGWGTEQLEDEVAEGTWIILPAQPRYVFEWAPERLWRDLIASLGEEMALLANYPDDPQMN